MTITDDMLMAYADGELGPEAVVQIEEALASDPELARRVARLRDQRRRLQAAFDGTLGEPVPARLVAAAHGIPSIRPARRWRWPELTAMAASLIVGAVGAWTVLRVTPDASLVATPDGLVARGALARSLTDSLAGDAGAGGFRVSLSFRDRSGAYCRTFAAGERSGTAGVACRMGDEWRVKMITEAAPGGPEAPYRMAAAALPPELLRAVEERMAGEPLDAAGEEAARARGWAEQR